MKRNSYIIANQGIRCMAIAKTVDSGLSEWKFLGLLTFLDPPRPDTAKTIQDAEEYGVKVCYMFHVIYTNMYFLCFFFISF